LQYLAIEKMRFGARLLVRFEIAPEAREAQVPRFLLQPLIENAIRHGISKRKEGGHIAVRALILDKSLMIEVENEGMQGKGVDTPKPTGQDRGVGLVNTRARLEQLYGSAARLNARAPERGNFVVSIAIPFTGSEHTREPCLQESVQ
jgi:two-component system LytT family sensor kinase